MCRKKPVLYRIWTRTRRKQISGWERKVQVHWDKARPGSSVEVAAVVRQWKAEVAVANGLETGACLWDVAKFFDSVDVALLIANAKAMAYPLVELAVAVQQYVAKRALQRGGHTGEPFEVTTSILPGCGQAVPLARAYLRGPVGQVQAHGAKEEVMLTTYVDDIGQDVQGSFDQVVLKLVEHGHRVVQALQVLRLKVAPKSVVVASFKKIASMVQRMLQQEGVQVQAADVARDLGVAYSAGRCRRGNLTKGRVRAAIDKLGKVRSFAKKHKQVRRVAVAAAMPQATWGVAAGGMSPTAVAGLRSALAGAAGASKGRCKTTLIASVFGMANDPAVRVPTKVLETWFLLLRDYPELRSATRAAGGKVYQQVVVREVPVWSKVAGPIGAVIATLVSQGWAARQYEVWRSPANDLFILDFDQPNWVFLQELAMSIEARLWKHAAEGWNGSGLSGGIAKNMTFALARRLRRAEDCQGAGMLEAIMSNGGWSDERVAVTLAQPLLPCAHCGEPNTDYHQVWGCSRHEHSEDKAIALSQRYKPTEAEAAAEQAFFFRGILGLGRLEVATPYRTELCLRFLHHKPDWGMWPGGRYYTDGSGGDLGAYPMVRRCGIGIAQIAKVR